MAKDKTEIIEKAADQTLALMGTKAKSKVSFDKENEAYVVQIDSDEETGLLIGRHGETLLSMETILGMMVKQQTGEWFRIVVNVGDWREKQEDYLKNLAVQAADRAEETQEPQPIYNLSAAQRRIVHMALSTDERVETESIGEDKDRYLVVKPKEK